MSSSARPPKAAYEATTLLASTTQTGATAGASGSAVRLPVSRAMAFTLDVTAAATAVGDILDVYVQTKADGTNWLDVVRFARVLGNGGTKRYVAKLCAAVTTSEFENGTGLAASNVRNLFGDEWRVYYVVTDAAPANAAFTFSVTACPM